MTTEIQIHTPKFGDPYGYIGVVRWQEINKHVLALCPARWKDLHDKQKWVLLRILAARGKDYTPDWIDPEIWRKLAPQLRISDFDTDTAILEDGRRHGLPGKRLATGDMPLSRGSMTIYDEIMAGEAPQHIQDGPVHKHRLTYGLRGGRNE